MTRLAFGSEVPEIAAEDLLEEFSLVRLKEVEERNIADRVERAAMLRSDADALEDQAVQRLERALDAMISAHTV